MRAIGPCCGHIAEGHASAGGCAAVGCTCERTRRSAAQQARQAAARADRDASPRPAKAATPKSRAAHIVTQTGMRIDLAAVNAMLLDAYRCKIVLDLDSETLRLRHAALCDPDGVPIP